MIFFVDSLCFALIVVVFLQNFFFAIQADLKINSLTNFFSKVYERFVVSWLLHYVGEQLDWCQYEGMKGSSITHYLIDFENYILI